jgi:NAD(P)H-flavin reductase/ferredoxin
MAKVSISINGRFIQASTGDTLVDAAMSARILIPHDCCSGQCSTCRVRLEAGTIDDRGSRQGDTVLACQARVNGTASITFDELPAMSRRAGVVTSVTPVSSDVVEILVTLNSPFRYLPGQYVNLTFPGCPPRDYSPAPRLNGAFSETELAFQIRRYPGGVVSSAIGGSIVPGARVRIAGPFGSAFFRDPRQNIVLVAGGTGWAPIWSIARAALGRGYSERIKILVGATSPEALYMRESFGWLADRGFDRLIATCDQGADGDLRTGRPTDFLPALNADDDVYVAGAPALVDAVASKAADAKARCFSDPFLPGIHMRSLADRVIDALRVRGPNNVLSPIPRPVADVEQPQVRGVRAGAPRLLATARALLGRRTGGV